MKNQVDKLALSDELIAAYLDGNATLAETQLVLQTMKHDAQLRELLQISSRVDADMALSLRKYDYLPMTALAAECGDEHLCSLVCEQYIMPNITNARIMFTIAIPPSPKLMVKALRLSNCSFIFSWF